MCASSTLTCFHNISIQSILYTFITSRWPSWQINMIHLVIHLIYTLIKEIINQYFSISMTTYLLSEWQLYIGLSEKSITWLFCNKNFVTQKKEGKQLRKWYLPHKKTVWIILSAWGQGLLTIAVVSLCS